MKPSKEKCEKMIKFMEKEFNSSYPVVTAGCKIKRGMAVSVENGVAMPFNQ